MKFTNILVVMALMLSGGLILSFTTPTTKSASKEVVRVSQNKDLDFKIVNKTGYDIKDVFIAPSDSKDWGDDVMEGEVLKNGANVDIVFHPKATSKLWDISVGWVGYDASEEVVWSKLDLSAINKLTLKYDEKTNKTWAEKE